MKKKKEFRPPIPFRSKSINSNKVRVKISLKNEVFAKTLCLYHLRTINVYGVYIRYICIIKMYMHGGWSEMLISEQGVYKQYKSF